MSRNRKSYSLGRFLLDVILGMVTGGLWWVWLVLKFLFKNS